MNPDEQNNIQPPQQPEPPAPTPTQMPAGAPTEAMPAQQPVVSPPPSPAQPTPPTPQPHMAAFMYPESSQSSPPKKSKKLLVVIAVLLVVIGAVAAAVALTGNNSDAPVPSQADQQSDDASESSSVELHYLSDNVKLASAPTFTIPSVDGWEEDDTQPGVQGMAHADGCKVYYSQTTERTAEAAPDAEGTDEVLQKMYADLTSGTVSDVSYGTAAIAITGQDKKLEFKTTTFTYATGLTEYKSIVTARQVDGYVLGVRFNCPIPVFSPTPNQQILDQTKVNLDIQE